MVRTGWPSEALTGPEGAPSGWAGAGVCCVELTSPGPCVPCTPGAVLGAALTCRILPQHPWHQHPFLSCCSGGSGGAGRGEAWASAGCFLQVDSHSASAGRSQARCVGSSLLEPRAGSGRAGGPGSRAGGGLGRNLQEVLSQAPPPSTRSGKVQVPFTEQGPAWPRTRGPHLGGQGFSGSSTSPERRRKWRCRASRCAVTGHSVPPCAG